MKITISEWAQINEMTPDEFKDELIKTMAAVGSMELDSADNTENASIMSFGAEDSNYEYKVIVTRKALSN